MDREFDVYGGLQLVWIIPQRVLLSYMSVSVIDDDPGFHNSSGGLDDVIA